MHLALGEEAEAWRRVDEAVAGRDLYLSVIRGEPALDGFLGDPRFTEVMRTVGL